MAFTWTRLLLAGRICGLLAVLAILTQLSAAQSVVSITASGPSVLGGSTVQVTITLSAPAPSGGLTIDGGSTNESVIPTDFPLEMPAGQSSITRDLEAQPVSANTSVKILAATGTGPTLGASVEVLAPTPSIFVYQGTFRDSGTITLMVTLNGPAPATGIIYYPISSSSVALCGTCNIPGGKTSGFFLTFNG